MFIALYMYMYIHCIVTSVHDQCSSFARLKKFGERDRRLSKSDLKVNAIHNMLTYCTWSVSPLAEPPSLPPPFTLPYQPLMRLSHSTVLLKVLYNIFSEAAKDSSKLWSVRLLHQVNISIVYNKGSGLTCNISRPFTYQLWCWPKNID